MKLTGRFRVSKFWPDHIPGVEDRVFLNIGSSGPNFVRTASTIDGVSMVQSTSLQTGRDYEFTMDLKARKTGRFHVHPVLNVLNTGTLVGGGRWITIEPGAQPFDNKVETMFGREVDLETYNLNVVYSWHLLWFLVGGAWLAYWFRRRPLLIPRYREVQSLEDAGEDPDQLITATDRKVAAGFVAVTLVLIIGGYQWAEARHPVTTPLRTAKVDVPEKPAPVSSIDVKLEEATYRIPGRSFQMTLTVDNHSNQVVEVGEFATANVRFINPSVQSVEPHDSHDLVAPQGLRVEGGPLTPGDSHVIKVFAEDALWETQRLTLLINDPDSIIVGLLFFYGPDGSREIVEVGGPMLPVFQ